MPAPPPPGSHSIPLYPHSSYRLTFPDSLTPHLLCPHPSWLLTSPPSVFTPLRNSSCLLPPNLSSDPQIQAPVVHILTSFVALHAFPASPATSQPHMSPYFPSPLSPPFLSSSLLTSDTSPHLTPSCTHVLTPCHTSLPSLTLPCLLRPSYNSHLLIPAHVRRPSSLCTL